MRKQVFLFFSALSVASVSSYAQDIREAYNLSNLTAQGTARSIGFGGALGSVGGDFSSLSVNPAGIGIYRTSELTFTPSLKINGASSEYLGTTTTDNNVRFNINNFGIVITDAPKGKRYDRRNWKTVSFAFGMNRVADFNRTYTYSGKNSTSSATQAFESDANQYPGDVSSTTASNLPGYLGYQSYLIDQATGGSYYSVVPYSSGINQTKTVKERGRVNEYVFTLGGNYKEQFMLGATLGIPTLNYEMKSTYSEYLGTTAHISNPSGFKSFSYNQDLSITGTGVNLKIGGIYKITDEVRIGASFHSPTAYTITDIYKPNIVSDVNNAVTTLSVGNGFLVQNQYDYTFVSPWRTVLSATYIMKGIGFITADYEYVGYNSMRYIYNEDPDYNTNLALQQQEDAMNRSLKDTYMGTSNFRVGAEGLITKFFMARAGFGYYGNALKQSGENNQRMDISGGVGFRSNGFFADVALVHSMYDENYQPYSVDYSYVTSGASAVMPRDKTSFGINNLAVTVGVKF